MDEERFYKRLENLESSSQATAVQLAKLNAHIESETGNKTYHLDALYKITSRHDKLLVGDGSKDALIFIPSALDGIRDEIQKHTLQDNVNFEEHKKDIGWVKSICLMGLGALGLIQLIPVLMAIFKIRG